MNGQDYVVKAEHPRRPGQPLRLTDKTGRFLAQSGDRCGHVSPEHLVSFVRNDYVDFAPEEDAKPARRTRKEPA